MSDETRLRAWTNDYDTCIAADIADVERVLRAYGYGPGDVDWTEFVPVADDTEITIHCDTSGNPATPGDEGVGPITKTAREWCARGPGFLCTTEY